MKKYKISLGICLLLILQSCYFGSGLIERNITDKYFLFANSSMEEMSIWLNVDKNVNNLIIPQTVFAIGKNNDFIIAKSHHFSLNKGIEKGITNYYIIEVNKKIDIQSPKLTLEEFKLKRKKLGIPKELEFEIVFEELK